MTPTHLPRHAPRGGLRCHRCGSLNTWRSATYPRTTTDEIVRRRRCADCGATFRTVERWDPRDTAPFRLPHEPTRSGRVAKGDRSKKGKAPPPADATPPELPHLFLGSSPVCLRCGCTEREASAGQDCAQPPETD